MNLIIEYGNGQMKVTESNQETNPEDIGWTTNLDFQYCAKELYKTFAKEMERMRINGSEKNITPIGRLELKLGTLSFK